MNADFVVMVRQTHHERHCILSLRRELSRTLVEGSVERLSGLNTKIISVYLRKSASYFDGK